MKNGWPSRRLDEVCVKIQDGAHRSPQVLYAEPGEGRFPYLTSTNIRTGYLRLEGVQYCDAAFHNAIYPRCNVEVGDVLLTKDGANTGNVAINTLDEPFSLLSSVCLLKPDSTKLLSGYLFYYIQSDDGFEQITGQMTGAAIKRIILKTIKSSPIPLPPLPEQRRIVGILDEAFEGIATAKANADKNLQNARALFESHLNAVFTQRGPGWVATILGEVCEFVGGSQPPKSVFSKTKTADNIRLIQIRDYKSDKHIVYIPRAQAKRFCSADDVMIGRYGPPLFQILRGLDGAYNVALMKAVPNETKLSRDFLFYFLKHSKILEYVIYHSNRAAGQIGVTKETLAPYPIALPSLATQQTVVETITDLESKTQRLESIYQRKLAALDELKKSLLHQAFSGEL